MKEATKEKERENKNQAKHESHSVTREFIQTYISPFLSVSPLASSKTALILISLCSLTWQTAAYMGHACDGWSCVRTKHLYGNGF